MSIDHQIVKKIAKLSKIKINQEEADIFSKELNSILKWIDELQEVNTDGVEPLQSVVSLELPKREDNVTDGNIRDEVIKNASISKYGCFVVPKVIE
jgi:aspartyl-tRNA(Asn)/glutamyl-tRNA(Gln) amidotransferase subunit C